MARCIAALPYHLLVAGLLILHSLESVLARDISYLSPGFHFDYDQPNLPLPIPITSQCERIHLKWSRGGNDTGPSPIAPYFMQVFTSTNSTPFIIPAGFGPTFDWDVPFAPNTRYQICMFDINGVSGGCQATYTVIANTTTNSTSCQNVTAPSALSVSATVPLGAMTQYSYIDQCTSLTVTPNAGNPPFTLTVAPESHPPYNISSNGAVSWQVTLPVGFKFFLSLQSADGLMWANGPLRVGGLGPIGCLAPGTIDKSFADKIIVGGSIAGMVFGVVAGIIGVLIFLRLQRQRRAPSQLYFGGQYFSRDSPSRPLKAPSTLAPSVMAPSSYIPSSPTTLSIPLMPATPGSRNLDFPTTPPPPLRPLTPLRRPRRQRSADPHASPPQSELGSTSTRSNTTTTHSTTHTTTHASPTQYPADVKRPLPLPTTDISIISRDDNASLVSSSTNARINPRPVSTHSQAPTYMTRSAPLRGAAHAIDEDEVAEMPPEYGRHIDDPSLNYAPSILSSGNRF